MRTTSQHPWVVSIHVCFFLFQPEYRRIDLALWQEGVMETLESPNSEILSIFFGGISSQPSQPFAAGFPCPSGYWSSDEGSSTCSGCFPLLSDERVQRWGDWNLQGCWVHPELKLQIFSHWQGITWLFGI